MRNDNYKSFIPTRMPNGMPYEFKFHHLFDEQDDYGKIKYIKECFNKILEENVKRYVYSKKANFSQEDLDYFFDFTD